MCHEQHLAGVNKKIQNFIVSRNPMKTIKVIQHKRFQFDSILHICLINYSVSLRVKEMGVVIILSGGVLG